MNSKALILILHETTGKILLQDRHEISKNGEEWGTFWGGIEIGETPKQWVTRELQEELHLTASNKMVFLEMFSFLSRWKNKKCYVFLDFSTQDSFTDYEWSGAVYFTVPEIKKLNLGWWEGFNEWFFPILDNVADKYINIK